MQDCTRANEDRELKDKLLCKYSGYISTLKHEFSKKKKKGKLPKEAREVLLNWWTVHYKWPYPTVIISLKQISSPAENPNLSLALMYRILLENLNAWSSPIIAFYCF